MEENLLWKTDDGETILFGFKVKTLTKRIRKLSPLIYMTFLFSGMMNVMFLKYVDLWAVLHEINEEEALVKLEREAMWCALWEFFYLILLNFHLPANSATNEEDISYILSGTWKINPLRIVLLTIHVLLASMTLMKLYAIVKKNVEMLKDYIRYRFYYLIAVSISFTLSCFYVAWIYFYDGSTFYPLLHTIVLLISGVNFILLLIFDIGTLLRICEIQTTNGIAIL